MTPNPHANPIPNILTGLRLIAGIGGIALALRRRAPAAAPLSEEEKRRLSALLEKNNKV